MFPALVLYALTYFLLPSIRYFVNTRKNEEIKIRNERRLKWAKTVQSSDTFDKKFNKACQVAFEMANERKKKNNENNNTNGMCICRGTNKCRN